MKILVGESFMKMMEATLKGDKEAMAQISADIKKKSDESTARDIEKMSTVISREELNVFVVINSSLKSHSFSYSISSMGDKFRYWWYLEGVETKPTEWNIEEGDTNQVFVLFDKNGWHIAIHISYEGYGPGTVYLRKNIPYTEIQDVIQNGKQFDNR